MMLGVEKIQRLFIAEATRDSLFQSMLETLKVISMFQADAALNNYHNITLGLSVGIAYYPVDTKNVDEVVSIADEALYLAKRAGKNRYKVYEKSENK